MKELIEQLPVWATAITQKSKGKVKGIDNQHLYGIQKMRELILDLAIRGKLVPQDPNDEPASELLKKIAKEKELLVRDKKIKKTRKSPAIDETEMPSKKPQGWEFVRLNDLGDWGAGATPLRSKPEYYGGQIPWFKSGELIDDYISETEEKITELAVKETSVRSNKKGDVLIAMYGATIGKTSILSIPATTNQAVCACTPFSGFNNTYLLTFFKAMKPSFTKMGAGGAQPNISREKIIATVICLPPTNEQKRIVAKVNELMGLCDELEKQQVTQNKTHYLLVKSLLQSLTNATNAEDFQSTWQLIVAQFEHLFTTEESIDLLKQAILQLAVMGKLVPQNPNDEPASELLKKIAVEKQRLIKEGKIKKQKPLPEITENEKPFELPVGWEFERMGEICNLITDGTHLTPKYTEAGRIFISAQNIKPFQFLPENHRWVSEEDFQGYIKNRKPEFGDILLTRVGAGIGEAAVVDVELEFAIYVSVGLLKVNQEYLNPNYLALWLNSPMGRKYSERNTYGKGVSQGNLNLSLIRNFVISIPPVSEQYQIIKKVEELFTLCDQLKENIIKSEDIKVKLGDCVVGGVE